MKKQILFLALFVLAVLSSTINSFGQTAVHHNYPQPLNCPNDPLHPIAGKKYTYGVNVDATHAGGNYTWWATKDQNFATTSAGVTSYNVDKKLPKDATNLLDYNAEYGKTVASPTTVDITWSSAILNGTSYQGATAPGTPTFVVVHYEGTGTGTNCADNLKVYEINPVNGFTIDIKNIANEKIVAGVLPAADTLAFGATDDQCVDIVRSAKYASNNNIDYDFGTNILYFEVIAANVTGTFTPSFKIDGLIGTQEAKIEYDDNLAFSSPKLVVAAATAADNGTLLTGNKFSNGSVTVDPTETNPSRGVSIYVRVTVSNKTHETLTSNAITLSVDGQATSGYDVVNGTAGSDDCLANAEDFVDAATQTINPRPDVTTNITPAPTTAPTTIIPNNP